MKFHQRSVLEIRTPNSGITYNLAFEAVLTAKHFLYQLEQFEVLPVERQALLMAAHRLIGHVESIVEHDRHQKQLRELTRAA